jgi:glutathione S-transferase
MIKKMALKLTYFDFPARAYPIRTAFRLGGIDFVDEKITFPQLAESKGAAGYSAAYPLGSVPVLTLPDGRVITQSAAIARYAGKLSNIYPSDPLEALFVDEIVDTVADIISSIPQTSDQEAKKTLREAYANGKLKIFFGFLSSKLASSSGPYVRGDKLTLADIYVYSIVKGFRGGNIDFIPTTYDTAWPNLEEFVQTMQSNPTFAPHALP